MLTTETAASPRPGFGRRKLHHLRIDMTPMVDLGFLLISFFVITTQLSAPKAMDLFMPDDGPPTVLGESTALTVMLHKNNRIYYYHGSWENAMNAGAIHQTNYSGKSGLRRIIEVKQRALDNNPKIKNGRAELMLLIKAGDESSYKNVVDVLDEATITMVKKYAVVPFADSELKWLSGTK